MEVKKIVNLKYDYMEEKKNNNLKALKSISFPSAKQVQSSFNSMHQLFLCCSDLKNEDEEDEEEFAAFK